MLPRQEYPGHLIAVARRRIKQAVLARAAVHGLSTQQFWTVVALHEAAGRSQGELAARLRVDAPTASRVLAALVRRRLVRMEADPGDRRRTRLFLTRAGEDLARALTRSAEEIRAAVIDGMTAAEVEALRRGLRKVIDNLERLDANGVAAGGAA
jgi:DNA-binding MarR family transcriptional regulator